MAAEPMNEAQAEARDAITRLMAKWRKEAVRRVLEAREEEHG